MSQTSHSAETRFWKLVDKDGELPEHQPELGNCWNWTGGKWKQGYGRFIVEWDAVAKKARIESAHRWSYRHYVGELTDDFDVCHKCDNPSCVRFDHLFKGTTADNMKDCSMKGRTVSKFTEEDVKYIRASKLRHKDLASMFDVSRVTITHIRSGKRWQHSGFTSEQEKANIKDGSLSRRIDKRLTKDDLTHIKSSDLTNRELAVVYSVSASVISKIKNNKQPSNLP